MLALQPASKNIDMAALNEILVIGGTGAQGIPVVKALSASKQYRVRILTRDSQSYRAQQLAKLPNVDLLQGKVDNEEDLHRAFRGVYGAWVNIDTFTLGEKNELFYGIRAYEIARHEGVKHYVWAGIPYALKRSNWNEKYHYAHGDVKGRITDFILAQGQEGMKSSILTTVPYMDMLIDGLFVPRELPDGSFAWINPATTGKFPFIALEDVGHYSLWLFDNLPESAGLDLRIVTDYASFSDIASTFTSVTGKQGVHKSVSLEEYLPLVEPYPNAPMNWAVGPLNGAGDVPTMSWRENFSAWWAYWNDGADGVGDLDFLTRIHPNRIKTVDEWMRKVGYDGRRKAGKVLKDVGDLIERNPEVHIVNAS
ncbi:hypothetical protein D9757_006993 [Collybiopsis confluens]|uniref:NmrA-like domain-containing protein n=1 Tax=Collybiopsis confluens TaxID=2823264 RepID=A0A8H5CRQ0_9AGAR|nr:hypothetical protein D9757_014060 [Collybiopsis confluens]KAF5384002.1 hypothetical protein D9757_006993 [Collybiopsis confluens]